MKNLLIDYEKEKVNVFVNYIEFLKKELDKDNKAKNWWLSKVTKEEFANAFVKVASTGLFIDGDTVTLTYRKQLLITYDYHAYQNKILAAYPETKFDFGIVHEGDTFTISKESGKVIYSHKIANPFAKDNEIIGAYGVIKNNKGEFIETINLDDIDKMRKSSTMGFIWNTWFARMVLKSVIKRLCAVHFKDLVKEIEVQDNELNDPTRAEFDESLLLAIDEATTEDELGKIYNANISKVPEKKQFIELLTKRKLEIKK
jgi:recombinational DNA repair protein RecT